MTVFAAFVAAVLRWCGESEAIVRFQSDGRFSPLLEHSVGYFACVLNLRLELRSQDSFLDLLERVTHEYCAACEHADSSYIDAQLPAYEFTRNPSFNWVPQPPGTRLAAHDVPAGKLGFHPFEFALPPDNRPDEESDYEPSIALFDRGARIEGRLVFRARAHRVVTMEAFRDSLLRMIAGLMGDPTRTGLSDPTP